MRDSSLFLIAAAKRRERGITLDHIANTTKISVRSLKAIEEADFAKLPGGIYNTSYIRQYARAIDVDEYELVETYRTFSSLNANPAHDKKTVIRGFQPAMQQ
jgi:cytoskeletal protein RodZ